ncbi:hypothetical protein [Xanthomonas vasicola]|uniref:hypothetical protein n=1 Tax=Xanthomonas vasicola TaxID=56459 RepID=UPI00034819D1|nr:hypothetical protein [Xanthomonas vasicola]KFA39860.1 hypothetical protein KWS_0100595 [Xanthomonas vasicola pv. musacearum NCPPB 4384]AZR33116.1 hypothetical protein KWO_022200 [Xanthomonas vasicola pv. musacearum NCPPB 4379]KFA16087.1 hypothetical protein KWQ_0100275 [Xanthomonas vasicola pv. musacearum NCPPB 4380]KFA20772.1 hypothetical protein A11G_0103850 [Xanthomonas vasicola pv. musacearum NCPPB 4392]MBV7280241.1 hypothetical protein [Xanthomonas vasicola pv. musacearum]
MAQDHDELHQVTAERDFLAGLVEQHEARLRTFSADLQHVLLAEFSGEDLGHEYLGAWQRLHALIAPVATGYTPTPDEAVPASVARLNALAALDQDSSADACPARADPHETYALNVTLSRGDAALFQGHRFAHERLSQILGSYRELVLRHMPQFTPDEWAALAEMLNDACNEAHYDYLQGMTQDAQLGYVPHGPWTTDVDRLADVAAERAAERTAQQRKRNADPCDLVAPTVDLLDLAARLSALTDVQRLATYEKLMPLLYPDRCDLVAYDEADQAATDAAIAELLNTQS